jgi:crossover junction endodeoxyribonuclease RusA
MSTRYHGDARMDAERFANSLGDGPAREDGLEGALRSANKPLTSPARARKAVRSLNPKQVESVSLPNLGAVLPGPRSFSFKCDMPPTANHMHTVARGRKIKSAKYRLWLEAAAWEFRIGANYRLLFQEPVAVSIALPRKHALSDLDNRIKPILDAMQLGGVLENDNLVHEINAKWRPKSYQDQERVWLTVTELS